jgi:hypothetical protein
MDVPGCSCVKAGLKETCNARGGCVVQGVAVMVGEVDAQALRWLCHVVGGYGSTPVQGAESYNARGGCALLGGGCGNAGG